MSDQTQLFSSSTFHTIADDCSTVAHARAYAMAQAGHEQWPSGTKVIVHYQPKNLPRRAHFTIQIGRCQQSHTWDSARHLYCPLCPKPNLDELIEAAAEELFGNPELSSDLPF